MPMFAIQSWKSHNDLKAEKGSLDLWFTAEITGPPSGTYPVLVDFIWPNGNATRVPKTFTLPFKTGRSQLDLKAHLDDVKPGHHALRLTIAGEQLDDLPFTVTNGPRIKRMVIKAQVVESGKLLATVMTQEDLYGDTRFLTFESIPTDLPSELHIAQRFADEYRQLDKGRDLVELIRGDPFPDIEAVDRSNRGPVTLELTQLAYEGWQGLSDRASKLKQAIRSILVSHRPKYRARAMILYFKADGKTPRIPSPNTKASKAFLRDFDQALEGGWWAIHTLPRSGSEKPLQLETLVAPVDLVKFHHHLRKVELGPNNPSDPRLPSPDDSLLLLHTEKVVEEGDFSALVAQTLNKKLAKGESYWADILLIHNAADPHVLVAAEDDDVVDLARKVVTDANARERFKEVWLFDIWDNSIFKLS